MVFWANLGALCVLAVTHLVAGEQPDAATRDVGTRKRDLIWGRLNFLQTTDVHGWLAGHLQEPDYSADWGDYVSFAKHMRDKANRDGVDLLVVDAGDRVEGNGLYDSSEPKGKYYYDIYKQQDIDIICTGNHELYRAFVVEREHNTVVPNFQNTYIASNVNYKNSTSGQLEPLAPRYRKIKTRNQGLDIVAFGFLFDFDRANHTNSHVQLVRDAVTEPWFEAAMREEVDVFVIDGHVGVEMPEFQTTVFNAIRKWNPHTPLVFLGGHTHLRNATMYDKNAISFSAGRYFETVGWVSVDGPLKRAERDATNPEADRFTFNRKYIDTNLHSFWHHSGVNKTLFDTPKGKNTSDMIRDARITMGLDERYGCAPRNYWLTQVENGHQNSVYTLLTDQVLPGLDYGIPPSSLPRLTLMNSGAIRFDIFKGNFTRDSRFNSFPFQNNFLYIPRVPYGQIKSLYNILENWEKFYQEPTPYLLALGLPLCELRARRETYVAPQDALELAARSAAQLPLDHADAEFEDDDDFEFNRPKYVTTRGHTTLDGISNDGDDSIHYPISYYEPPHIIMTKPFATGATPDTTPEYTEPGEYDDVEFVYIDFMHKYILKVFEDFNWDTSNLKKPKQAVDKSLDALLVDWARKNWDCVKHDIARQRRAYRRAYREANP